MENVWLYTAIAGGVYAFLLIADAILKKIKTRKVAKANDRRTSDCPAGTSTAE